MFLVPKFIKTKLYVLTVINSFNGWFFVVYNRNVEGIFIVLFTVTTFHEYFSLSCLIVEQWICPFKPTRHDWYHKKI